MAVPHSLQDLTKAAILAINTGKNKEAVQLACVAVTRPDAGHVQRLVFSEALRLHPAAALDPLLKKALTLALEHDDIEVQLLAPSWRYIFELDDFYAPFWNLPEDSNAAWSAIEKILQDPFVIHGFRSLLLISWKFEQNIVSLRRRMLLEFFPEGRLKTKHLPFVCALATHCFSNEYVFDETPEESEAVQKLSLTDPVSIALLGAYRPLADYDFNIKLSAVSAFRRMMGVLVENPRREREIAQSIVSPKSFENEITKNVQGMYEENPYPRWTSVNISANRHEDVQGDILVAGCGTGKTLIPFSSTFAACDFTAIDISKASMAYAMRMAEERGLDNISFVHMDILDVGHLGKKFDIIECSGVLHHMADPIAGWQALIDCLKPGGQMMICLYSTIARKGIEEVRQYIKSKDYKPTLEDIRKVRNDIAALPEGHPFKSAMAVRDFYSVSQMRDLVFHVQETTYEISELQKMLDQLGLVFDGFKFDEKLMAMYKQEFPDNGDALNLGKWQQIEHKNPDMFIGMYKFLCHRKNEEIAPVSQAIAALYK